MNYGAWFDFQWFCQFKSTGELKRICGALEKEIGLKHKTLKRRSSIVKRLEGLVDRRFAACVFLPSMIIERDVIGDLREWWKERKNN